MRPRIKKVTRERVKVELKARNVTTWERENANMEKLNHLFQEKNTVVVCRHCIVQCGIQSKDRVFCVCTKV